MSIRIRVNFGKELRFAMQVVSPLVILGCFLFQSARAQSSSSTPDTLLKPTRKTVDSTLVRSASPVEGYFRRPTARRQGTSTLFTREALRYYGAPITVPQLMEESGEAFPLIMSDVGYGRESMLFTGRVNDPLLGGTINGVVPTSDPLTGHTMLSYLPIDAFSDITVQHGATGLAREGAQHAASDAVNLTVERFRAPIPYSRIHFTQMLSESHSNFDGVFAVNASRALNVALGIGRRSSGRTLSQGDVIVNPRIDLWSTRAQVTYESFLGTLPRDSTMTAHKIDSILALPESRRNSLDVTLWANYTTAFTGLSRGISPRDSDDVFNRVIAPVYDPTSFDHRVRADAFLQADLPFISDERTRVAGYFTYSARRLFPSTTTGYTLAASVAGASRIGASLEQPLGLTVGSFQTKAMLRGDVERVDKPSISRLGRSLSDTRLSATGSDSLALSGLLGVGLFGYARLVQSTLKIESDPADAIVLPQIGLSGSIAISNAVSFTASYDYQKDRASLSLSPSEQYQIRNIAGYLDLHVPLGRHDSISGRFGVRDRHEPVGTVYRYWEDTARPLPFFSNADLHSQSAEIMLDAFIHHFHWAFSLTYLPVADPIPQFAQDPQFAVQPRQRFFGQTGLFYENELAEGNLRMSFGARVRYLDRLSPALTYDPAIDEYVYLGAPRRFLSESGTSVRFEDARIEQPKGIVDLLIAAEIDRRTQINMSFLNVTSAPYYNVELYPRTAFQWRIDVTWAFLD